MKRRRIDVTENKSHHYQLQCQQFCDLLSLKSQPKDTMELIISFMDFEDLMNVSMSCQDFHLIITHCDSYIKTALLYYSKQSSIQQNSMYQLQIFNTVKYCFVLYLIMIILSSLYINSLYFAFEPQSP